MRNIEPPLGRGSATKLLEIFESRGAIAEMNALIGACTLSRKRCLFSSNQGRSLCALSSRKKAKKSLGKPVNGAVIALMSFGALLRRHLRMTNENAPVIVRCARSAPRTPQLFLDAGAPGNYTPAPWLALSPFECCHCRVHETRV